MKSFRSKPVGWRQESYRHYLAAKYGSASTYKKWRKLVNMSPTELERFKASEEGKVAGLSRKEASSMGIRSGRDSASAIIRMKRKPRSEWTGDDEKWMRRQVSFVSRMKGNPGKLYDEKGRPTRKLLSLKIWGHNPEKKEYYAKKVDLKKYAGTWKQVSVKPEPWFQRGLTNVTATYKLRKDGKVDVINKGVKDGKTKVAKGVAESVSKDNRKLAVSFAPFGLFPGEYNIKSLNKDYTRVVVQGGKTTWVLKR